MRNIDLQELYRAALPSVDKEPLARLPKGLYRFVWKVSGPQQVRLCLLTLLLFPLSMVPLELQRRIVNSALAQVDIGVLVDLGAVYLAVLLLAGALKYVRNLYLGRVSEGVIRRLRIRVSSVLARDEDLKEFGARVSMIAAETEQLGGFVGEAIAQPLLSAGILLSVASYMLWTEPQVALVAFAFFIPSLLIAPWLQERINRYGKQRTELLRELSQGVVVDEGHSEEKKTDGFKDLIGEIYAVRVRLYAVKFFAKFLNNFMGHLGVLAVLVFGGMMVIEGRTDIGVVVAFISGFERIIEPARELLNFYRQQSQMRVQYFLIRDSLPSAP
jgi:ABC-type bacteriocin/lantibiotic exporter with double-glycine peptidase domain